MNSTSLWLTSVSSCVRFPKDFLLDRGVSPLVTGEVLLDQLAVNAAHVGERVGQVLANVDLPAGYVILQMTFRFGPDSTGLHVSSGATAARLVRGQIGSGRVSLTKLKAMVARRVAEVVGISER